MKTVFLFTAILLIFADQIYGQIRTIHGHVIDEDLRPLPSIFIRIANHQQLVRCNSEGQFRIDISPATKKIFLGNIGYEEANITLNNNCDTVEIVLLLSATYDFMSARKIDKERLKSFRRLPQLHLQAYQKRIFSEPSACYSIDFEPAKPALDSISKEHSYRMKQIKTYFKKLSVGDTIKVPFSKEYHNRDTTTLIRNSAYGDNDKYDFTTKCVVIGKNQYQRGYNLLCKVIECDTCKDICVFDHIVMKTGAVFNYNMRYFKVFNNWHGQFRPQQSLQKPLGM